MNPPMLDGGEPIFAIKLAVEIASGAGTPDKDGDSYFLASNGSPKRMLSLSVQFMIHACCET